MGRERGGDPLVVARAWTVVAWVAGAWTVVARVAGVWTVVARAWTMVRGKD